MSRLRTRFRNLGVYAAMTQLMNLVTLPAPHREGDTSLEIALSRRRSVRVFRDAALTLDEVSQLLWAAQGVTSRDSMRTAPSAGALYPLEIYLVAGNVRDVDPGIYRYSVSQHTLLRSVSGDLRAACASAALDQEWIAGAAAVTVIVAAMQRTTRKYGSRGVRYVHIEVGHAAQNLFLQAVALGLDAAVVGAFDDDRLGALLGLPAGEEPLYLMPVGRS